MLSQRPHPPRPGLKDNVELQRGDPAGRSVGTQNAGRRDASVAAWAPTILRPGMGAIQMGGENWSLGCDSGCGGESGTYCELADWLQKESK